MSRIIFHLVIKSLDMKQAKDTDVSSTLIMLHLTVTADNLVLKSMVTTTLISLSIARCKHIKNQQTHSLPFFSERTDSRPPQP